MNNKKCPIHFKLGMWIPVRYSLQKVTKVYMTILNYHIYWISGNWFLLRLNTMLYSNDELPKIIVFCLSFCPTSKFSLLLQLFDSNNPYKVDFGLGMILGYSYSLLYPFAAASQNKCSLPISPKTTNFMLFSFIL